MNKYTQMLSQALDTMHEIDKRTNYGHILPISAFDNTVREGQKKEQELKDALNSYNKDKDSEHRYLDRGIDHYAHRYTTARASQQSPLLGAMMLAAAFGKEIPDFLIYSIKENPEYAWEQGKKDLTEDLRGYRIGKNKGIVLEQDPEFNKYNGGTVKFLLENIIKAKK